MQLINTRIILFMSSLFPRSLLWKEGRASISSLNKSHFLCPFLIKHHYHRLYYTEQHCHRAGRLIQVNILLWRPRKSISCLPRTDLIWSPAQNNVIMAHQKSCKKVTDRSLELYLIILLSLRGCLHHRFKLVPYQFLFIMCTRNMFSDGKEKKCLKITFSF